jgi:hypothetical protein
MKCKRVLVQAAELQRDPSREEIEYEMLRQKSRKKQPVGTPNVSYISGSGSGAQVPSTSLAMEVKSMKRDFYTRMAGIEASMKAIMTALNIPIVPDPNTCNVQQPSSFEQRQSTPNTGITECLLNSVRFFPELNRNLHW